jgi:hypothetical protein
VIIDVRDLCGLQPDERGEVSHIVAGERHQPHGCLLPTCLREQCRAAGAQQRGRGILERDRGRIERAPSNLGTNWLGGGIDDSRREQHLATYGIAAKRVDVDDDSRGTIT